MSGSNLSVVKHRNEVTLSLFAVLIILLLPSCTASRGAPPSASKKVEASAKGLAQLFQRECIDQLDLDWVRDEIERRRWFECGGAADDDDCMMRVAVMIEWTVKTTANSNIEVTMLLPKVAEVPGPGRLGCAVNLTEQPGKLVMQAATRLKIDGHSLRGPFKKPVPEESDTYRAWEWSLAGDPNNKPRLLLVYDRALDNYRKYLQSQDPPATPDPQIWNMDRQAQERPWTLSYQPR